MNCDQHVPTFSNNWSLILLSSHQSSLFYSSMSVRPFTLSNNKKTTNLHLEIMFTIGRTVWLAEWIINDPLSCNNCLHSCISSLILARLMVFCLPSVLWRKISSPEIRNRWELISFVICTKFSLTASIESLCSKWFDMLLLTLYWNYRTINNPWEKRLIEKLNWFNLLRHILFYSLQNKKINHGTLPFRCSNLCIKV